MATIYQCDRCTKQSTTQLVHVNIPHLHSDSYTESDSEDTFKRDLCKQCHKELVDFMKASKQVPR